MIKTTTNLVSAFVLVIFFIVQSSFAKNAQCLYYYDSANLVAITQLLSEPSGMVPDSTLNKIKETLGLDSINFKYLQVLMKAYTNAKKGDTAKSLVLIADHGTIDQSKTNQVIPTAVAPKELLNEIPMTEYSSIQKNIAEYTDTSKKVRFWVKKLMAGTGSGIVRVEYLKDLYSKMNKSGAVKIGSKGTDLHADVVINGQSHLLNIAELQILQLLVQSDNYKQVIFQDVVSNETSDRIHQTWISPNSLFQGKSLFEIANEKGERVVTPSVQFHIPTISENGNLTKERLAPAGHGLFAIEAIQAALTNNLPSTKANEPLIGVIGNGEDLMSTPSPGIVGWVAKEQIPIVMVTTDKTALDKQGGQIAIGLSPKGEKYVTIVEKAQAETAVKMGYSDQFNLFTSLGLRPGDNKAMFNTNMVVINFNSLQPKLVKLAIKVGGNERLLDLIAPDLIPNTKEQKTSDGVTKKFTQLEGAMGSVVLKLDKLYRENFNEPLVHFLNIDQQNRTQFFAPIKTSFDFFMQFYSDRFEFDTKNFKIVDKRPGHIPKVTLNDDYYKEAANVLSAFKGTKILYLDELVIEGKNVSLAGMTLKGTIRIKNNSGAPQDLSKIIGKHNLENIEIIINESGEVSIATITPTNN